MLSSKAPGRAAMHFPLRAGASMSDEGVRE